MSGYSPMFSGFAYIEEVGKAEGLRPDEVIRKYGHTALYRDYYPDGYSACVKDQECRGNKDAKTACQRLMAGDPTGIKREKGMAKGTLWMGECNSVFTTTKLGNMMEATAITGTVLGNALSGKDPYRQTGGIGSTTPETSVLQEAGTKIGDAVGGWKMPQIGFGFKAMSGAVIFFIVAVIALIALGYSGLGGSAGRVAEREHAKRR